MANMAVNEDSSSTFIHPPIKTEPTDYHNTLKKEPSDNNFEEPVDYPEFFDLKQLNELKFEIKHEKIKNEGLDNTWECSEGDNLVKNEDDFKCEEGVTLSKKSKKHFSCDLCLFTSTRKIHYQNHRKGHLKGIELSCDKCVFTTIDKHKLQNHNLIVHETQSDATTFKCDQCVYETNYKKNFNLHKYHHLKAKQKREQEKEHTPKKAETPGMYQCKKCPFETSNKASLTTHTAAMHPNPEDSAMFNCDLCPYKSKIKGYVQRHRRIHLRIRSLSCDKCDYKTNSKERFQKHVLTVHEGKVVEGKFPCDLCDYKGDSKATLNRHKQTHINPKDRELKCEKCCFKTLTSKTLQRHERTVHEGKALDLVFSCDMCKYRAPYRYVLLRHQKKHFKSDVDVFRCDECEFETKRKSSFRKHMGSHDN